MAIHSWGRDLKVVLGESAVASTAATLVLLLELPVWAMFVGWIAFFTRGLNVRSGLINLLCVLIGMALGMDGCRLPHRRAKPATRRANAGGDHRHRHCAIAGESAAG